MIGYIDKSNPISFYQPSKEVADFTKEVQKDFQNGVEILNKQYVELNDRSVIEDENRGQMMFNAFVDTSVEDPNEAWKWRGTRSMARNKGIAMHANLTANFLLPLFTAQNENDETDRDFSEVMRDIIEWMAEPTNSNYQSSFLQIVFGMITNPVTYLGAEYLEVYQTIKDKTETGEFTTKEVLDEVLSGFQAPIYSSTQVLISNAYERNIQRQRCLWERRFVEKSELEGKYGQHDNWAFVKEGQKSIFNPEDGLFYDVRDDDHPTLVVEETYKNRRGDTEVCFVGGVYLGDDDLEKGNMIQHRDNLGNPKYNKVPFGYHRIGEHFFYYKSMMNAVGWDNMLYDAMSEVVMNRAFLEVDMPVAISGADQFDSEVVFPKSVVTLEDKDAKISPLLPQSNMIAGFNALRETEKSISEGTVNPTMAGQLPDNDQKAFSVAQAQNSARKLISGVGRSLAESIVQYGDLMKDIAINHITIPQVEELVGGAMKLKYRSFFLPNKNSGGKKVGRTYKFDESLIGAEMTDSEQKYENLKMLEKIGYPENKESLRRINPELWAKFKYLTHTDVEEMFTKNNEYWQPILAELKTQLALDPYVDQEWLTRKLLYAFFQSEGEDGIKKNPSAAQNMGAQIPNNQFAQQFKNKALSTATSDVGAV